MKFTAAILFAVLVSLAVACARSAETTHEPHAAPLKSSLVGQLLLPGVGGSRGVEILAQYLDTGGKPQPAWVRFDQQGRFAHTFTGRVTEVRVTAGADVHRIDAQHLPAPDRSGRIDLGVVDLRDRLQEHRMRLRPADGAEQGDARIGLWIDPPPVGPQGEPVSLGSAQFPELQLGSEVDWLLPPETHSVYFLVERPSDSRRGRDWRSGRQQLFGPFTTAQFPRASHARSMR